MWLQLTVLIFVLIWYGQFYWDRRNLYKCAKNLPSPKKEWPFVGILHHALVKGPYKFVTFLLSSEHKLYKIWFGPFLFFSVVDPEYVKIILNNPHAISKLWFYKYAECIVGKGLLTAPVSTWKRNRRIGLPSFTPKVLRSFVNIFIKKTNKLCEILEQHVNKEEFDIFPAINATTLDSVLETVIGTEFSLKELYQVGEYIERLTDIATYRLYHMYIPQWVFKLSKFHREEKLLTEKFGNFSKKAINQRQQTLMQLNKSETTNQTYLDLLLEFSFNNKNIFNVSNVKDEIKTMLFAGSDTTANTLSFAFLMLALHPDIQERVYQEVVSVVGLNSDVEAEHLPHLEYTERVIKETLRLFPVAPIIGREVTEDLKLEENVIIPKNISCLIPIIQIHRDPKIWPEPFKFDPDRFLPEEVAQRHPYSFIPFSGGQRNCLGIRYAMMTAKVIIAMVTRKFVLQTSYKSVEDIELEISLTLKARNKWKISLQHRKH